MPVSAQTHFGLWEIYSPWASQKKSFAYAFTRHLSSGASVTHWVPVRYVSVFAFGRRLEGGFNWCTNISSVDERKVEGMPDTHTKHK